MYDPSRTSIVVNVSGETKLLSAPELPLPPPAPAEQTNKSRRDTKAVIKATAKGDIKAAAKGDTEAATKAGTMATEAFKAKTVAEAVQKNFANKILSNKMVAKNLIDDTSASLLDNLYVLLYTFVSDGIVDVLNLDVFCNLFRIALAWGMFFRKSPACSAIILHFKPPSAHN